MHQAALVSVAAAATFAASLVLTPLARRMAWRCGAVCRPDGKRKLQARPTALFGGGAVYLALLFGLVGAWMLASDAVQDKLPAALGLSAGLLCLLGVYDDLYDMRARWKLLGQILATLPVVAVGSYATDLVLLDHTFHVGPMGMVLTIGWLVLGINALNFLDGVDGLASLVGIAIAVAIGAIAAGEHRPEVMLLAFVLAGALAGFLVHNLPPARIYLGDCGSMIVGFTLALLAYRVSLLPHSPGEARVTVAAALLFLPLLDVALAILRRTLNGTGLMVADRDHVHHQLLKRGWSSWRVIAVLTAVTLSTGAVACWVSLSGKEFWGWILLASGTVLLVARKLIARQEWLLAKQLFKSHETPEADAPQVSPEAPRPILFRIHGKSKEETPAQTRKAA